MAPLMALVVEFKRMLVMALPIIGIAIAARIVPTSNAITSSVVVKPRELFHFTEKFGQ